MNMNNGINQKVYFVDNVNINILHAYIIQKLYYVFQKFTKLI